MLWGGGFCIKVNKFFWEFFGLTFLIDLIYNKSQSTVFM